eukprot:SAG31_NODE_36932_length_309_cov_0.709524_1_plen_60_part_01
MAKIDISVGARYDIWADINLATLGRCGGFGGGGLEIYIKPHLPSKSDRLAAVLPEPEPDR